MNPIRKKRVERQIQRELSTLLVNGELKDPRLAQLITITRVEISPDMSMAKAFVSVYGDEESRGEAWAGLVSATGFIQYNITRNLRLRIVPRIRFMRDDSLYEGDEVVEQIHREEESARKLGAEADQPEDDSSSSPQTPPIDFE